MGALRWLPLLCVFCTQTAGAEVTNLQVESKGKRYDIRFDVLTTAPPERVLHLFSDPTRWTELSKVVKRSERLNTSAGHKAPVSIVFQTCVLFLCREANKVSIFYVNAATGTVSGRSIPGRGNFRYAWERWQITPHASGARIHFTGIFEPTFAVPPLIGTHAFKSVLRKMLIEMETNLENLSD
ncbi:MAG: SRPBCC family protein [Chromatiales bacterium]|jgi:hypothetical protein|nr:SRPBCC family protein [Chromatiales bacterium]